MATDRYFEMHCVHIWDKTHERTIGLIAVGTPKDAKAAAARLESTKYLPQDEGITYECGRLTRKYEKEHPQSRPFHTVYKTVSASLSIADIFAAKINGQGG